MVDVQPAVKNKMVLMCLQNQMLDINCLVCLKAKKRLRNEKEKVEREKVTKGKWKQVHRKGKQEGGKEWSMCKWFKVSVFVHTRV